VQHQEQPRGTLLTRPANAVLCHRYVQ
jgi:hypothetical protein